MSIKCGGVTGDLVPLYLALREQQERSAGLHLSVFVEIVLRGNEEAV